MGHVALDRLPEPFRSDGAEQRRTSGVGVAGGDRQSMEARKTLNGVLYMVPVTLVCASLGLAGRLVPSGVCAVR